jgi:hypothetical protein
MDTPHETTRWVHEGRYAAAVPVELEYSDDTSSPTMSLADAEELDRVRTAERRGDHEAASKDAKVFELLPLAG